jgi:hypothetical protein
MFSAVFWNIFGPDRLEKWPAARQCLNDANVVAFQETLQHRGVLQLPEKTPFFRRAKPAVNEGRPSGGLTTYLDNGLFGAASFTKLCDDDHFLCLRVALDGFAFILGNVYLPLNSKKTKVVDEFVELFEAELFSILDLFPTDPVLIGGDFNCHCFAPSNRPHELRFKDMLRRLHSHDFSVYPQVEAPFTYRLEESFSTIDYVLVRGFRDVNFRVALEFAAVTNHRPLFIQLHLPIPSPSTDLTLHPAKGSAYFRSTAKREVLRNLLDTLAANDARPLDLHPSEIQKQYDEVENCFELCTKRTLRKPVSEGWESQIDPDDSAALNDLRAEVTARESKLEPSSSASDFTALRIARDRLNLLVKKLQQKAITVIAEKERGEAHQHAATWKLLSSFGQKRVQPEVPPSAVFEHYRSISQVPGAPLHVDEVPQLFTGPLLREDAALENDITEAEVATALDDLNQRSAPGPDGLTPRLVRFALRTVLLVAFFARFLTRCFRSVFVPSQWRTSENFVLYKGKGPTDDVSSFRAISLTQMLAKV